MTWNDFLRDDHAQDLIEYSLLMAFVVLASAALFIGAGQSTQGIWASANSTLSGNICSDAPGAPANPCN